MGERRGERISVGGRASPGVVGGEKGSQGSYGERGSVEDTLERRLQKNNTKIQWRKSKKFIQSCIFAWAEKICCCFVISTRPLIQ